MEFPLLSFFTGGGFLDLGFEQAGFKVVWTNENNAAFAEMYAHAMTAWRKAEGKRPFRARISNKKSITALSAAGVRREAFGTTMPEIFGLIGGPPCPDFSNGGKHAGGSGENGKLTREFVEMICRIRPKFFVIENVAGLYRFRKHRWFLSRQIAYLRREGGYSVDLKLLNSLELGVPQDRERLFVVGFCKSLANRALGRVVKPKETDWFAWPSVEEYAKAKSLRWPQTCRFGYTPAQPRGVPLELTVYPAFLGNGDPEKIQNGKEHFNSYSPRFLDVDEGDVSRKSFKRLHRYRFSPTAWYGNQEVHLHPWKPRRLSVREALRIQTVPDEYVLPAESSLSAKFKMICNGVPCLMASRLAAAIKEFIESGLG